MSLHVLRSVSQSVVPRDSYQAGMTKVSALITGALQPPGHMHMAIGVCVGGGGGGPRPPRAGGRGGCLKFRFKKLSRCF